MSRYLIAFTVLFAGLLAAPRAACPAVPDAQAITAFLQALGAQDSTSVQRQEAWQKLMASGQSLPKSVTDAVDLRRTRAWKQFDAIVNSAPVAKAAAGLRGQVAAQGPKVREVVASDNFSRARLDEAGAPLRQGLDEALAVLRAQPDYGPTVQMIDEMEDYAAQGGLRVGWTAELRDTLFTLALVARYAGGSKLLIDANQRLGGWIEPGEEACIARLNVHRLLIGLEPLALDLHLVIAARKHSEEMVARNYFSHDSPTASLKLPAQRARREYTRFGGECIANVRNAIEAFTAWHYSQLHHQIMVLPAPAAGVGRCSTKWTLMIGGSRSPNEQGTRMAQYVRQRYQAGDDAEKLFELAQWCVKAKLMTQAADELQRVVGLKPDHPQAAAALANLRARGY